MSKSAISRQRQRTPTKRAPAIQYISDESGNLTGVIIPFELWSEIESEKETAYLLKSEAMRRRLLKAKKSKKGIPFEEVCEKLSAGSGL